MISKIVFLLYALMLPTFVQAQFIYTTNSDGTLNISGYTGPGGAVTIPNTINGLPVTSIGVDAFYADSSLTSITIPNSVTSIADAAFFSTGAAKSPMALVMALPLTRSSPITRTACEIVLTWRSSANRGELAICSTLAENTGSAEMNSLTSRMWTFYR